eukprot:2867466-Pleurochrysis_carterae.AAC.1
MPELDAADAVESSHDAAPPAAAPAAERQARRAAAHGGAAVGPQQLGAAAALLPAGAVRQLALPLLGGGARRDGRRRRRAARLGPAQPQAQRQADAAAAGPARALLAQPARLVLGAHLELRLPVHLRVAPPLSPFDRLRPLARAAAAAAALARARPRRGLARALRVAAQPAAAPKGAHLPLARNGLGLQGDGALREPQGAARSRVLWRGRHRPRPDARVLHARLARAAPRRPGPLAQRGGAACQGWRRRRQDVRLHALWPLPAARAAGRRRRRHWQPHYAALHLHRPLRSKSDARQPPRRPALLHRLLPLPARARARYGRPRLYLAADEPLAQAAAGLSDAVRAGVGQGRAERRAACIAHAAGRRRCRLGPRLHAARLPARRARAARRRARGDPRQPFRVRAARAADHAAYGRARPDGGLWARLLRGVWRRASARLFARRARPALQRRARVVGARRRHRAAQV